MNHRLYLGLGILILLLIAGGTFLFYSQYQELQQLKQDTEEADKLLEDNNKPIADNTSPVAREGFKMVPHDDHFHEVPIDAPDTWQGEPVVQPAQAKKTPTYTGPLTYHEELLKTNPVEALRKQTEERGHWSAKWIPPFPSDDKEAAEIARTEYLIIYYKTIGDTDNPKYQKALDASWEQGDRMAKALREAYNGRVADLMILTWPRFPESDVPPLYEKGWRKSPSNYFPTRIEDLKFPLQIPDSK